MLSRAHANVLHSFLFSPCYSFLLCVCDIIKLPFLLPCDDVLFECIVQKIQNTESNKKVPRESKNAGSIYNVSNSVRKCHKKITRVGRFRFEGDNWVSYPKWKWILDYWGWIFWRNFGKFSELNWLLAKLKNRDKAQTRVFNNDQEAKSYEIVVRRGKNYKIIVRRGKTYEFT